MTEVVIYTGPISSITLRKYVTGPVELVVQGSYPEESAQVFLDATAAKQLRMAIGVLMPEVVN